MLSHFRSVLDYIEKHSRYPIKANILWPKSRDESWAKAIDARISVYGATGIRITHSDTCGLFIEHDPMMSLISDYELETIVKPNLGDDLDEVLEVVEAYWRKYEVLVSERYKERYLSFESRLGNLPEFPGDDNIDSQSADDVLPFVESIFGPHAARASDRQRQGSGAIVFHLFEYIDLDFVHWLQDRIIGWYYYEPIVPKYYIFDQYSFDYPTTRNDQRMLSQLLEIRDWAVSFLPEDYLEKQFLTYGPLPDVSDIRAEIGAYLRAFSKEG